MRPVFNMSVSVILEIKNAWASFQLLFLIVTVYWCISIINTKEPGAFMATFQGFQLPKSIYFYVYRGFLDLFGHKIWAWK